MDTRQFLREEVASRPMMVGGAAALAMGLAVGGYLSVGALLEEPPPTRAARPIVTPAPQPITYMTDSNGRVPDYVIGTDNLPGRKKPSPTRAAVERPVDDRFEERQAPRWFWPFSWGRDRAREEALQRQAEMEAAREAQWRAEEARRERMADLARQRAWEEARRAEAAQRRDYAPYGRWQEPPPNDRRRFAYDEPPPYEADRYAEPEEPPYGPPPYEPRTGYAPYPPPYTGFR